MRFCVYWTKEPDGRRVQRGKGDLDEIEWYRIDRDGRATSRDYENYDKFGLPKWSTNASIDYYCTACKWGSNYMQDVLEHIAWKPPEDVDLTDQLPHGMRRRPGDFKKKPWL
jgi:hypothetical protein